MARTRNLPKNPESIGAFIVSQLVNHIEEDTKVEVERIVNETSEAVPSSAVKNTHVAYYKAIMKKQGEVFAS